MEEFAGLLRLATVVLAILGGALLFAASRRRGAGGLFVPLGWTAIVAALFCSSKTSGADRGVALGIIVVIAVVALFLLVMALRSPRRSSKPRSGKAAAPSTVELGCRGWGRRIFVGVLLGPIAGIAALSLSAGVYVFFAKAGISPDNNLVAVFFVFPLAWAALSVFVGYDRHLLRKSLIVLGALVAPLSLILVS